MSKIQVRPHSSEQVTEYTCGVCGDTTTDEDVHKRHRNAPLVGFYLPKGAVYRLDKKGNHIYTIIRTRSPDQIMLTNLGHLIEEDSNALFQKIMKQTGQEVHTVTHYGHTFGYNDNGTSRGHMWDNGEGNDISQNSLHELDQEEYDNLMEEFGDKIKDWAKDFKGLELEVTRGVLAPVEFEAVDN